MKTSTTINKLMPSLTKELSEIKSIKKDAQNPFLKNKYISLDIILESVKPIMTDNQMAIMQTISNDGVETFLIHTSGEWISSGALLITPQESKGLSLAQSMGVATTYAKRYQLGSLVGINADDDTDGQYGDNSGFKAKPSITASQFDKVLERASDPQVIENTYKHFTLTPEQTKQLNKEAGL